MSQTQSLKKKSAQDSGEKQSLQRSAQKNSDEALNKKATATPEETPALQKKIYRTTEPEQPEGNAQRKPRLQTKLSVSEPGDSHEQEADRVADEVVSRSAAPVAEENKLNPGNTKPENNAASPQSLQTKISRMEEPAAESAPVETEVPSTETEAATDAAANSEQGVSEEVEQQIAGMRGQGAQLPEQLRTELEGQFNHDFSSVSIHTGGTADVLCKKLSARAFTVGSDIFFASGEYAPDSQEGKRLLAHELTHVVQQGSGVTRKIMRDVTPAPSPAVSPGSDAETKLNELCKLELPPIKHRHAALYTGHGARRAAGYARNTSEQQIDVWKRDVNLTEAIIAQKIQASLQRSNPNATFTIPSSPHAMVNFSLPGSPTPISGQWRGLRNQLLIPDWDRRGVALTTRENKFQVDHMIELQVYGDSTGNSGNVVGNMELLKGSSNASSGSTIKNKIYEKVFDFLGAQDSNFATLAEDTKKARRRSFLSAHTINFTEMVRGSGRGGDDADWWTKAEIETGAHMDILQAAPATRLQGSSGNFVFATGPGGSEIRRYSYTGFPIAVTDPAGQNAFAGIIINSFNLNNQVEVGTEGADVGTIQGTWNLPQGFASGAAVTIPLKAIGPYCAGPGQIPPLNTTFNHLSPVEFTEFEIRNNELYSMGRIPTPTIPLLSRAQIGLVLQGDDIRFQIQYNTGMLNLPIPGVSIDDSSIALFYSVQQGFGAEGSLDFGINNLGAGNLSVAASQESGFSASGNFSFDTSLFDRARIGIWYRNGAFGGSGEIGIDTPNKIRGIRRANLNVSFTEGNFSATGDIQPAIPGVQQAGLRVIYTEQEGLTIGGNLQLNNETPGLQSGSVDVTLNKRDGLWKVSATGTAVPAIPGVNSQLTINYNDGTFTAEANADYSRGMLSGRVNAGVTNRTVNADGSLSETASEGNPLVIYGGGQLTLQIAPWLQGTAGVRFAPNGEVTVTGEIGLPSQLEIFARKEINKSIFNIAVQAPIFPGIVAEVGGGLSATAGIGPGVLDRLSLGITYNPAHEDQTRITGDAHLNIPANAGLRLSVRAGIGLGITGASATGGLDIGGTLGIEGAAEAGVHVEWTPATGLDLRAEIAVHAQPSFTFDIGGYVSVRALGFEVYDNRWQFASYTFGSDYRFGIRLPIHYHEGEPFDISLDDVQFEVPNIDTDQLLSGLIARIA